MAQRRPWVLWPKNVKDELTGVSGISGIGGAAISVAGVTAFAGSAALLIGSLGLVIFGGTLIYAGIKAIPKKTINPGMILGESITLDQLNLIYPPIKKLAVIGPRSSGKTTLKTNLAFDPKSKTRTQTVTAQIVSIPVSPTKYLAILDGAGEKLAQQFEIAEEADFICIMVDHNNSDSINDLSKKRIDENKNFLEQIRSTLADANLPRKKWIEILVNKEDLWENASSKHKSQLSNFSQKELYKWRNSNLADDVRMHNHSNERMDDINRFMEALKVEIKK